MDKVYIHKLNAQELGYREGQPHKAGRYLYVSKRYADFFPPLSESIKNDHIIVDLVPPDSDKIVLTNYVYHNDKIAENIPNGRDEFRLYFNEANDPGRDYFKPDDIVAIKQFSKADNILYKIYRYNRTENRIAYDKLNELLVTNDTRNASHALIPADIVSMLTPEPLNLDIENKIAPDDVRKAVFEDPIIIPERPVHEITRQVRSVAFRDLVLLFYDYQCAITGKDSLIEYGSLSNLHGAHIIPVASGGSDNPSNGLPLVRDLHWAFDNGFFTVEPDYKIAVHPKVQNLPYLSRINNKPIILPEDSRAKPNPVSLGWHKEKVFGQFLKKQ